VKRLIIVITLFVFAACARHDDMPPPLSVTAPPEPQNLTVTTNDNQTFDLNWDVDDPSVVDHYAIYTQITVLGQQLPIEYQGDVDGTFAQVIFDAPITGGTEITFCVASVTIENVESRLVCAMAED
jgi:hypothetical protein